MTIYDVVAREFYGIDLSEERRADIHLRSVARRLERLREIDPTSINRTRAPAMRIAGRCNHHALLLAALLREAGQPARLRYGFASYFVPERFEDHVICEVWQPIEGRWAQVDAQLDSVWWERLGIGWDVLDLPPGQFMTAGEAWDRCRRGQADPAHFGISFNSLHGLWFVASSLIRDLAALGRLELLPWDVWGDHPGSDERLAEMGLGRFDELAGLLRDPKAHLMEIRERVAADPGLRVPAIVFNALTQRTEPLPSAAVDMAS